MLKAFIIALTLTLTITAFGQETSKRITTASAVRLRAQPSTGSAVVDTLSVGTVLDGLSRSATRERVGDQEEFWYRVRTSDGKQGWIYGAFVREVDAGQLEEAYLEIARERLNAGQRSFSDWTDFVGFTERVAPRVSSRESRAELELARLQALGRSFYEIPYDAIDRPPYRPWVDSHKGEIVYHEPGGVWLVKSEAFWALHDRYKDTGVADWLAWAAATNTLPGECEGDVTCNLMFHSLTNGRYLSIYPKGAHVDEALTSINETLTALLEDLNGERHIADIPTEPEYRADLLRAVAELRKAVAPIDDPYAKRVVGQLDEIRRMAQ
jgi:hypothetical protein